MSDLAAQKMRLKQSSSHVIAYCVVPSVQCIPSIYMCGTCVITSSPIIPLIPQFTNDVHVCVYVCVCAYVVHLCACVCAHF